MIKKTVEFINFNGERDKETVYFNLTEAEVLRLDVEFDGGLEQKITNLDPENNPQEVLDLFERLIAAGYGEKSEDGRHFQKDPLASARFLSTATYSALLMDLIQDQDKAAAFFNNLLTRTTVEPPSNPTGPN